MKWQKIIPMFLWLIIISGCVPAKDSPEIITSLTPSPTLSEGNQSTTPDSLSTSSPTTLPRIYSVDEAILYEQDFESDYKKGITFDQGDWNLSLDDLGNHSLCNSNLPFDRILTFGNYLWEDYAFEFKAKAIEVGSNPNIVIEARYDDYSPSTWAAVNLNSGGLEIHTPNQGYDDGKFEVINGEWYTIRLEVFGIKTRFYVNNQMLSSWDNIGESHGMSRIYSPANSIMCFDEIRIWSLSKDGEIIVLPKIDFPTLEVVTDNAAIGDGGNPWGGHQTRIIRTSDGVFTAYTVDGSDKLHRKWRLAWRQENGAWPVVAEGESGKDPVNLLAGPDGTIYVVGWPNGIGTLWSGKPSNGKLEMKQETIPGLDTLPYLFDPNWPYSSAGIDSQGDLCILASQFKGNVPGASFKWSCYFPSKNQWINRTTQLDYRHTYTYIFPEPSGKLSLVSIKSDHWQALAYGLPIESYDWLYHGIGYWQTKDATSLQLTKIFEKNVEPTSSYPPSNLLLYIRDAFLDNEAKMHILYIIRDEGTQGNFEHHHVIISPEGSILDDVLIPPEVGDFSRIFQDSIGQFYILGSHGALYPAGLDGTTLGTPIQVIPDNNMVEYSGYGITVPRTGTPVSNILDVVFPSNNGKSWIYFQITLPGK